MSQKSGHAKAVEAEIRSKMSSGNSSTILWAFVSGVATALDGSLGLAGIDSRGGAGIANDVISLYRSGTSSTTLLANPYFTGNGQGGDNASSATSRYLKGRKWKSAASTVTSIGGGFSTPFTGGINVPSVGKNASSMVTTSVHFKRFADMARGSRSGGTVAQWLDLVAKLKAIKMAKRSVSLIGGTVPLPGLGMATGLLGTIASTGISITYSQACVATALELHWRAYQEQFMSGVIGGGAGGQVGPASKIIWELFTKRGISRILGKHDVKSIVSEPAGWMAISDKILLM